LAFFFLFFFFLVYAHAALPEAPQGWSVRYTTDLSEPVWYYLRGEEYSAQIDYFLQSIKLHRTDGINTFASALEADRVVEMILHGASTAAARPVQPVETQGTPVRGFWRRIFS
jgi:hypothetical protein